MNELRDTAQPTGRQAHRIYIGAWLAKLRDDKRCVVQAASAASKASDLLLGLLDPESTGEEHIAEAGPAQSG